MLIISGLINMPFTWGEIERYWKVLSRGVTFSDFYFKKITLVAILRIDCRVNKCEIREIN